MANIHRRSLLGMALIALAPAARAQADWPTKPVTLVLGFAAGGPNDLVARAMARRLSDQLGQQVIVENRPGANGNIAAQLVSRASPDGSTFLYNSSSLALSTALYPPGRVVDPLHDLLPVNGTATMPLVCLVAASSPIASFRDWVAALRANPGKLNFGSPGAGNLAHVAVEMVLADNGLKAVHIPYKGSSEALQGLLEGSIQFQFDSVNSPLTLIRSGRVRPLFVTSSERSPALPDVPTLAENGARNMDTGAWQGVMAPPKTPAPIVQRMGAEIAKAMGSPEMKAALSGMGAYSIASTPERYASFFAAEMNRYGRIVADLGLKLD